MGLGPRTPPGIWRSGRLASITVAILAAGAGLAGCNPEAGVARDLAAQCDSGDAAACNDLGWRVRQGDHVLADWRHAAELFERACDAGEGMGCVRLARLHVHSRGASRGVRHDTVRAMAFLERGCAEGAPRGCVDLADVHLDGSAADTATAIALLEDGCDRGSPAGCTRLGLLLATGKGVEPDPARGVELLGRACADGDALGCAHLGHAHELGLGVDADIARAVALYEDACETEMVGCFRLGELSRRGHGVPQDFEEAADLLGRACRGTMRRDVGSPAVGEACFALGEMVVNGAIERPLWRASQYFRSACNLGYQDACGRS